MTFQGLRDAIETELDVHGALAGRELTTDDVDDFTAQILGVLATARSGTPGFLARWRERRGVGVPGAKS